MKAETGSTGPPVPWLWTAAGGLAATLAGLAWDAVMHSLDHDLAAREGVFTVSNPSHALFVLGLAITALGIAGALVSGLGRPRRLRTPLAAGIMVVVLTTGGLGAWASVVTDEHGHQASTGQASPEMEHMHAVPAPAHDHASDKADVAAATADQRAAAQKLLDETLAGTAAYRDPAAAEEAGYRFGKTEMEEKPIYHVPNMAHRRDGHLLDARRPESLLYARDPQRDTLVLVGVLFRMEQAGVPGPAIGGPITVWHNHTHCIDPAGGEVGMSMDGSCPIGAEARTGPDMMHVWFTDDVATAFNGRRPPVRDLIAYQSGLTN